MHNLRIPKAVASGQGAVHAKLYCAQDIPDVREMADVHAENGAENADAMQAAVYTLTIQLNAAMRILCDLHRKGVYSEGLQQQVTWICGDWERSKEDD